MTSIYSSDSVDPKARDTMRQAKDAATQATGQVQGKAQEVAGQAQAQAKSAIAARKDQAAGELGSVAQAFRATSDELRNQNKVEIAQYTDKVADQVDRISSYLEQNDVDQLLGEAENFARRRPELFLGGAFIAGLLVGRFIKSSGERRKMEQRRQLELRHQSPYPYPEDYAESRQFEDQYTTLPDETGERYPAL